MKKYRYLCKHGVTQRQCVPCKGAGVCEHSRVRCQCRLCGGGSICKHDRIRSKCADCYPKGIYDLYIRGAKKRSHQFTLTFEDYLKLSSRACEYCGDRSVRNGIDRKDNSVGYTSENSVPCCSKCNLMKRNYSVREFLRHIRKIYKQRKIK